LASADGGRLSRGRGEGQVEGVECSQEHAYLIFAIDPKIIVGVGQTITGDKV
jgi:hypothetical protein